MITRRTRVARWASDKPMMAPCLPHSHTPKLLQVRTEERTGARELLGGIVGQAKGELEVKKEALASASGVAKREIGGPPPPVGAPPRFR
eukprot:364696-Chlamydomonas_euryale.AAC.3